MKEVAEYRKIKSEQKDARKLKRQLSTVDADLRKSTDPFENTLESYVQIKTNAMAVADKMADEEVILLAEKTLAKQKEAEA